MTSTADEQILSCMKNVHKKKRQGEGLKKFGRHVCMVPRGESSALGRFVNFRLPSTGAPLLAAHREAAVGTRERAVRLMSEDGRTDEDSEWR